MKKFSNMKLSRYIDVLLQANDILKIAQYMHENQDVLEEKFRSGTDDETIKRAAVNEQLKPLVSGQLLTAPVEADRSGEFYKVFRFETGNTKTIFDTDEDGKKVEGSEREVQDTSTVDIYNSAIGTRSTQFVYFGSADVSLAFSPSITYDFRMLIVGKNGSDTKKFVHVPFDEYTTPENLNKEAWLFRSLSPKYQIMFGYLVKHNCPGIDLYYQDIPRLMEILGLTRSTVLDIMELQ